MWISLDGIGWEECRPSLSEYRICHSCVTSELLSNARSADETCLCMHICTRGLHASYLDISIRAPNGRMSADLDEPQARDW